MASKISIVFLALCVVGAFGGHMRVKRGMKEAAEKALNTDKLAVCLKSGDRLYFEGLMANEELLLQFEAMKLTQALQGLSSTNIAYCYGIIQDLQIVLNGLDMGDKKILYELTIKSKAIGKLIEEILWALSEIVANKGLTQTQCVLVSDVGTKYIQPLLDLICKEQGEKLKLKCPK